MLFIIALFCTEGSLVTVLDRPRIKFRVAFFSAILCKKTDKSAKIWTQISILKKGLNAPKNLYFSLKSSHLPPREIYYAEKTELIEALHRVNEADVRFYETCEKLLKFARNAHQMFLNGSVEDKRFITQTVLSNSSYYDGNFDVELHPALDTLFRLSQASEQQNSTIER